MFANDYLHNNTYLFLQVVKTAYISTAFGICVGRSSCLYFPWQHHFIWRNLLMTAVYWYLQLIGELRINANKILGHRGLEVFAVLLS